MNENNRINENRSHSNLSETLNAVIELATRVDERVINLIKHQQSIDDKVSDHADDFHKLVNQVSLLESRLEDILDSMRVIRDLEMRMLTIENSTNKQEDRWKVIAGFTIQLIWVVLASFLLYKLGIQSPGVP